MKSSKCPGKENKKTEKKKAKEEGRRESKN